MDHYYADEGEKLPWSGLSSFIKKVVIEEGVTTIGYCAFYDNFENSYLNLEEITIPTSVEWIGYGSISETTVINYEGTSSEWLDLKSNPNHMGDYLEKQIVICQDKTLNPSGKCGENVTWEMDLANNCLIISGVGEMFDYERNKWGWLSDKIHKVVINQGVENIGERAFNNCFYLKEISFPDSVTEIGRFAFGNCKSLKQISIPATVEIIGEYAFAYSSGLKNIVLNEGLKEIRLGAFYDCYSLVIVEIPASVEKIGEVAFSRTKKIIVDSDNRYYSSDENGVLFDKEKTTLIQYPGGLKSESYVVPDSVLSIGDSAFKNSGLKSITLSKGLGLIGNRAFYGCESLKSIIIPDSVTKIGGSAFANSALKEIYFGKGLKSIGSYAFGDCKFLYEIVIPENVTTIGSSAFEKSNLRKVVIQGVTEIPYQAFYCCYSLSEVVISGSVTKISDWAFYGCDDLTEIVIPEGVTEIGEYAFQYTGIEKIWLPVSLSVLGRNSLRGTPLTKSGTPLTDIYYAGKPSQWSSMKYNYYKFYTPHYYSCRTEETASTCTTHGNITYFCDCCGASKFYKKLDLAPHNYVSSETSATCTKHGITNYACEECEAHYWAYTSNPTGHTFNEEGVCESCGEKEIVNNPSSSNTQLLNFESIFALIMNLLQKIFSVFTVPTV